MAIQHPDTRRALEELHEAIQGHRAEPAREALKHAAPDEVVALLEELRPAGLAAAVALVGDEPLAEALANADAAGVARLLVKLGRAQAADLLEEMAPDDAADVVEELPSEAAEAVLTEMEPADAADVRALLSYPPESAGGLMTPDFAAVRPDLTVEQALMAIRRVAAEAETIYYVYVVDAGRLVGVLSLRDLVVARPGTPLADVTKRDPLRVRVDADQEVAARLLSDHSLLALPVVDADDRLVGIITADDVMDVLHEEFSEDYLRLAGTDAEAMERRNPFQVARLRLPWLLGTMAIELGAGAVIAHFDDVLKEVILLASFMPVISAVSGNVGLQSAAIVVRGLDTGHVTFDRFGAQVAKELATSFLMALVCGAALGTIGAMWSGRWPFGIVIGVAMTCAMLTAGMMGTVIPMLSKRLGFDPATTAGPFETAFQDVIGFAVFLWLAAQLLQWLL
jgi:magnesium transporter